MRTFSEQVSPRELSEWQHEKEMLELQMEHAKTMKDKEIALAQLEAKWATWIKIPVYIVTMPVRILFVIPLTVYAITKQEVPEFYRKLVG